MRDHLEPEAPRMPRGRKASPEQIVVTLRQSEVQLAQGMSLALACKEAGISEQN